ncbi:hypothetical protein [Pelagibacterium xiamenense]|uniref:hypothetical protein n=1 Tax=Pelagibacterium xiamenense TaxID=2901140 RepID=UPI001E326C63|nr:hypothetical protein [Pelagibacterium xiamenense]MCD7058755.1 hypothetical protein [Pelagibacterium xiamenense]
MFRFIRRLLTEAIYIAPASACRGEPPDYLTLREIFDMPPYHPLSGRVMGRDRRNRNAD